MFDDASFCDSIETLRRIQPKKEDRPNSVSLVSSFGY